jgi:uncharacterized membrane protein
MLVHDTFGLIVAEASSTKIKHTAGYMAIFKIMTLQPAYGIIIMEPA